jgi:hypothetical protein
MSEIFDELAAASRNWSGEMPSGAMLSATRSFLSAAAQDEAVVREAATSLNTLDPGSAAWIAVAFGTLVERGVSAALSGPAVLDYLRSLLPGLPAPGSEENPRPEPPPEQATLIAQFQYLCQAAVAHLARLSTERQAMGQDAALLERLDELAVYTPGALWVREALLKTSGTLVLLHVASGTGLRLWYTNVSNNFHLLSLLQTAVGTAIPGGRVADDTIALMARGKASESITDEAWWHYGDATSPKSNVMASVWGELLVRDIPRVNGEQVILLWPPILARRTWDAGFLGPHLDAMPADAGVERMLTPEECKAWLEQLGIGPERKPWWRIW